MVAKGLGGLMRVAISQNSFRRFKMGNLVIEISHLQYADDTVLIGDPSVENLCTLKSVLRSVKLVRGSR